MQTVYIELIFLDNIIMNILILYTASFAIKARAKLLSILLSAGIGTLYAILIIAAKWPFLSLWSFKIGISLLMAYTAFFPRSIRAVLKSVCSLYIFTFVYGGAVIGLNFLFTGSMLLSGSVLYWSNSVRPIVIFVLLAFIMARVIIRSVRHKMHLTLCDTIINIDGVSQPMSALLDTGNSLREPLSDEPIVVCERQLLENSGALKNQKDFLNISCSSATGQIMMPCIRANNIKLREKNKEIILKNVWLGLSPHPLSTDGSYSALLPPELYQCMK